MPMDFAPPPLAPAVTVESSAPLHLSSLVCTSVPCATRPPRLVLPPELLSRIHRFWGDGHPMLAEFVVLVHAVGALADAEIEPVLERLASPVPFPHPLPLETESDVDRDVINARLARLARDRRLRARYVVIMRDLWSANRSEWESAGRAQAAEAVETWRRRLGQGADIADILPPNHIAMRPAYEPMTRAALSDGTLHLAPTLTSYGHIVALPGLMSVTAAYGPRHATTERMREAADIASQLKVLADPTRITILSLLANGPRAVGELAQELHIAQPTASVHLRRLREAGLVEVERAGGRSAHRLRPEAAARRLDDLSARLGQVIGAPDDAPPGP